MSQWAVGAGQKPHRSPLRSKMHSDSIMPYPSIPSDPVIPTGELGDGFGFPSSHSQWMGYFSAFLLCHLTFRHRFIPTGWWLVDVLWRMLVYAGLMSWALAVACSRSVIEYSSSRWMLTTVPHPKVLLVVPHPASGHLGLVYRCHLWHMLLYGGRGSPLRVASVGLRARADGCTGEPCKHMA